MHPLGLLYTQCDRLPTLAGSGQLDPRKGLSQAIRLISAAGSY